MSEKYDFVVTRYDSLRKDTLTADRIDVQLQWWNWTDVSMPDAIFDMGA